MEHWASVFSMIFDWKVLIFLPLGVIMGAIIGAIPGLTITMSISPGSRGLPSRRTTGARTPGISFAGRTFTYWSNSRRNNNSEPQSDTSSGTAAGQPTAPK